MPTRQISAISAAILLTFVVAIETSYLVAAPSEESSANRIGDYEVTGNLTYYEIASDSEYILDGEDTTIELNIGGPEEDGEFSMLNVVGVRATLTYADDEQSPVGCGSAEDSVSGNLMYSDLQVTEEVMSGRGLHNIYTALANHASAPVVFTEPAQITDAALNGTCKIAEATLTQFCRIMGSFAGNLALNMATTGGIFIGGGIANRFPEFIQNSDFRARFEAKGQMKHYVKDIPTYLIAEPDHGLLGAAAYLNQNTAS